MSYQNEKLVQQAKDVFETLKSELNKVKVDLSPNACVKEGKTRARSVRILYL